MAQTEKYNINMFKYLNMYIENNVSSGSTIYKFVNQIDNSH